MAASYGLGLKRPSAIPGFGLALGFTLTYLSLIVLIPLAALVLEVGDARARRILGGGHRTAHARRAALELRHLAVRGDASTPCSA